MIEVNIQRVSAVFGVLLLAWSPLAAAQEYDREITKTGVVDEDLFISGDEVDVQAEVHGDIVAMGEDVSITSVVFGDIVAMAGGLRLDSKVDGEVFAMGGHLLDESDAARGASLFGGSVTWSGKVNGPLLITGGSIRSRGSATGPVKIMGGKIRHEGSINGDLMVAGGKVEFTKESVVVGKAWVTSGKAEFAGVVDGELRIAAHSVEISGRIDGDVHIDGVEIEIKDNAVISGNLYYHSDREAEIDEGAMIGGDVEFSRSETPRRMVGFAFALAGMTALASVGGLILLGAVLLGMCPALFDRSSRNIGQAFWASLGIGAAIVVGGPVLITLLVSLVVGIPLALVVVAVYVMVLLAGLLASGTVIGGRVLRIFGRDGGTSYWQRLGVLALGTAILAVVALIPVLGAFVVFAALLVGSGAMARGLRRACSIAPAS